MPLAPTQSVMKPISILFVEDDPEMIAIYTENFLRPQFEIFSASNGEQALQILQQKSCKFDLVVTDNYMPQMDGITLSRKIHESFPQTKVIIVTGYGNWTDYVEAYDLGVCRFLDKPVKMSELKQLIQSLMNPP